MLDPFFVSRAHRTRSPLLTLGGECSYFDKLDDIADPEYKPDEQDILHSRTKTTGIIETEFDVGSHHFKYVDSLSSSGAAGSDRPHSVRARSGWWTWVVRRASARSGCTASRT